MKHDQDTGIMKAIRAGHATSTEIAAAAGLTIKLTVTVLNRLLDSSKVDRVKDGSGYVWKVAP